MPHLNIFQFNVTFICCTLSLSDNCVYNPQCCPFWCFFKRAWTAHLETPACFEYLFGGDLACWCSRKTLFCSCAESYHYSYFESILSLQHFFPFLSKTFAQYWLYYNFISIQISHVQIEMTYLCISVSQMVHITIFLFWDRISMQACPEEFTYNDWILCSHICFTHCWSCHGCTSLFYFEQQDLEKEN